MVTVTLTREQVAALERVLDRAEVYGDATGAERWTEAMNARAWWNADRRALRDLLDKLRRAPRAA